MESPDPQENLENLGLARLIRLRVKIIERVIGDEKNEIVVAYLLRAMPVVSIGRDKK